MITFKKKGQLLPASEFFKSLFKAFGMDVIHLAFAATIIEIGINIMFGFGMMFHIRHIIGIIFVLVGISYFLRHDVI